MRQIKTTDPLSNETETIYHDSTGRVTSQKDAKGEFTSFTYNPLGQVLTTTNREAEHTYDDRQMLKTIEWETAQIEDRSYNDAGMLTGVDRAYVDETRTYNAGSQLTQISSTNVGSQTYTYDLNGNVTSETLSGNMANYSFTTVSGGNSGYDGEDRFMRFIRSGVSEDIQLTRSDIGNISYVDLNGGNTARGYNSAHGLTSVGAASQTYDSDGNTTTLHTNVTPAWDDAGRAKHTNTPSGATAGIPGFNEYGYVGGLRVWKKITRGGSVVEHRVFIHAGPNLIAEYNARVDADTPVQEYVYADQIDSLMLIHRSNGTKYVVSRNRQWSVVALHDLANGDVVERYAYEMTGKRTIYAANGTTVRSNSSYGNNFGYTNRWHDEDSGLMYFRARYYNPLTGEFLSRDPLEFVDGMSLNRGYSGVYGRDPFGLQLVVQDDDVTQKEIYENWGVARAVGPYLWTIEDALAATNRMADAMKNDENGFGHRLHLAWLRSNDLSTPGVYDPSLSVLIQVRSESEQWFKLEVGKCVQTTSHTNGVLQCPPSYPVSIRGIKGSTGTMRQGNFPAPQSDEPPSYMYMAIGGFRYEVDGIAIRKPWPLNAAD